MRQSNLLLLPIVVLAQVTAGCGKADQSQKDREQQYREARAQKIINFAKAHNADYEWRDQFESSDRLQIFTAELQRAWIRSDNRPLAIDGTIDDVLALSGAYEVRAHTNVGLLGPTVYLRLDCTEAQAAVFMGAGPFAEFVFSTRDRSAIAAAASGENRRR